MPPTGVTSRLAAAAAQGFVLERSEAVPALIGRHQDFLFIAGLGGTACDVGAVTGDGAHVYSLGGAMGAACSMGLGLALARPDKRVLVVTGDGELLMNSVRSPPSPSSTRRTSPSSASTTATTARPAGRKVIPASASTSRRSQSVPASSARTPLRSTPISPPVRACCAKATARRSFCCGSSPPSRPSSSAISMLRCAAIASAPPCNRASSMETPSFRGDAKRRAMLGPRNAGMTAMEH